jgi:hypothetical protein
MNSNLRTDLLGNSQNLTSVIAAGHDIEAQPPAAEQFNFNEIYTLIIANPALAAQGDSLRQLIQAIQNSTQRLTRLGAIAQENTTQIKQDLSALLTTIAPSIAPYTGSGLSQIQFKAHRRIFRSHFIEEDQACGLDSQDKGTLTLAASMAVFMSGLILLMPATRSKHNKTNNLELGIGATLIILGALAAAHTMYTETTNGQPQRIARIHVNRALNDLFSTICVSRKTLIDFQNNNEEQPHYFKELAAKLFAARLIIDPRRGFERDNEKTKNILRVFSRIGTPEGLKFNAILREDTCDNMIDCINQLLTVPVIQDGNQQITLQADHILGANAAQSLYDCTNQLRSENGLDQWPETELTNGVVAEKIKLKSEKESVFDNVNPAIVAELLEKYTSIALTATSSPSNVTNQTQNPLLSADAADVEDEEPAPVTAQAYRITVNTSPEDKNKVHAKAAPISNTNHEMPALQATQLPQAFYAGQGSAANAATPTYNP